MRLFRILIILLISFTAVMALDENLLSWGLFNFFSDSEFSEEGLAKAEEFNPEKDILYLPPMGDKDLFESMRDLSIIRKKSVRKFLYIYLTNGREYVKRGIERSFIHKEAVDRIFAENPDIPAELALLPLLESGFNPLAVSRSKATGMWQFLNNTSRPLGLKTDGWIDERRDVEKSTRAAIRHLRSLYKVFKRWDLALAAYNGGGGCVSRAMAKSGARDIWRLHEKRALRDETGEYVPRFIALALIYNNQWLFDIKDEIERPEIEKMKVVSINYSIHLKHIAEISGIPADDIRTYNPELQKDMIPHMDNGYSLKIPAKAADVLNSGVDKLESYRLPVLKQYIVKAGDTIAAIARRHKKKTDVLIKSNGIKNPHALRPGIVLFIPVDK